MAYDETLAGRIRSALGKRHGLVEKKMFGGVGFVLRGNMACGVHKDMLIVRVGPEQDKAALARPGARPFDAMGRPMAGWVLVERKGFASDKDLAAWIKMGIEFAASLPPKK